MKSLVLAVSLLALSPASSSARDLAEVSRALGDAGVDFQGISSRAVCEGPQGSFRTNIVSMEDGSTLFVQTRDGSATEVLVHRGSVFTRDEATGAFAAADALLESFVRGHEVHRMLLALDRWFDLADEQPYDGCLALIQSDGSPARLCLDGDTGRPARVEMDIAQELGGGRVRIEFADWRERIGVSLPFAATFEHGGELFRYRFDEVLPFRLAPGTELPEAPDLARERLVDLASIASLHETVMEAHRVSDVEALLEHESETGVVSSRGRLIETTRSETRERLGPYLESTRFELYEDRVVPIIALARDGSLGWLACEMEARGTQVQSDGAEQPIEFGFSWVELLQRRDGVWTRVGNASSARP